MSKVDCQAKEKQAILLAYINAPAGQAGESIAAALNNLCPRPSPRMAVDLTARFPALIQSQALAHFSHFQGAAKKIRAAEPAETWETVESAIAADWTNPTVPAEHDEGFFPTHPGESRVDVSIERARALQAEANANSAREDEAGAARTRELLALQGSPASEIREFIERTFFPKDGPRSTDLTLLGLAKIFLRNTGEDNAKAENGGVA
ncbi:MAG: hypothetical protein JWO30_48 [Fibrobacteres bacterium]|nr:hypothetical protein [Fibrobacterota bacterium]